MIIIKFQESTSSVTTIKTNDASKSDWFQDAIKRAREKAKGGKY